MRPKNPETRRTGKLIELVVKRNDWNKRSAWYLEEFANLTVHIQRLETTRAWATARFPAGSIDRAGGIDRLGAGAIDRLRARAIDKVRTTDQSHSKLCGAIPSGKFAHSTTYFLGKSTNCPVFSTFEATTELVLSTAWVSLWKRSSLLGSLELSTERSGLSNSCICSVSNFVLSGIFYGFTPWKHQTWWKCASHWRSSEGMHTRVQRISTVRRSSRISWQKKLRKSFGFKWSQRKGLYQIRASVDEGSRAHYYRCSIRVFTLGWHLQNCSVWEPCFCYSISFTRWLGYVGRWVLSDTPLYILRTCHLPWPNLCFWISTPHLCDVVDSRLLYKVSRRGATNVSTRLNL